MTGAEYVIRQAHAFQAICALCDHTTSFYASPTDVAAAMDEHLTTHAPRPKDGSDG